jgi:hypothetical protein
VFPLRGKSLWKIEMWQYEGNLSLYVEALTKQNGVRLFGKLKKKFKKKKLKPTYPTLPFYKKKPETHIFFLA